MRAYPLRAFEEKPKPARAEELAELEAGVAWNAGMFLWRRRAIRTALERFTGLVQLIEPTLAAPALLEHAYERSKAISIDYAVMEGAARDGHVVMALDGRRLVAISARGPRCSAALGGTRRGARRPGGETVEVDGDDLVVRRVDGRLGVIAPLERGSMTAAQPIAVLARRRARPIDRIDALIDRCAEPGGRA